MVETKRKFTQINMEKLLGHSTVVIEPMFRITPEPFYAVDMVPSLRFPFLFAHHHMVTTKAKRGIRVPVISVVEASWFCML